MGNEKRNSLTVFLLGIMGVGISTFITICLSYYSWSSKTEQNNDKENNWDSLGLSTVDLFLHFWLMISYLFKLM